MVIELRLYLTDDPDEEPRIITHSSDQAPNTLILDVEPAVDGLDLPLSEVWTIRHLFKPASTNLRDAPYADYKFAGFQDRVGD